LKRDGYGARVASFERLEHAFDGVAVDSDLRGFMTVAAGSYYYQGLGLLWAADQDFTSSILVC